MLAPGSCVVGHEGFVSGGYALFYSILESVPEVHAAVRNPHKVDDGFFDAVNNDMLAHIPGQVEVWHIRSPVTR